MATVLSGLTASSLEASGAGPAATTAAQRLVTGDLASAASAFPSFDHAQLIHAYAEAFGILLPALAAITLLTALVIFVFLRRGGSE